MNNLVGWLKLFRKIQVSEIYFGEPFDKTHAWIDLLINVDPDEHIAMTKKGLVHLKPGQGIFSEEELASRWRWSRNKVRRFFGLLSDMKMIQIDGTTNGTVITIVKWDFYQSGGTDNDTDRGTDNGTDDGTDNGTDNGTLLKNKKNKKNKKKGKGADAPPSDKPDPHATDDEGIRRYLESVGYK